MKPSINGYILSERTIKGLPLHGIKNNFDKIYITSKFNLAIRTDELNTL
jgi:hypothetical protein